MQQQQTSKMTRDINVQLEEYHMIYYRDCYEASIYLGITFKEYQRDWILYHANIQINDERINMDRLFRYFISLHDDASLISFGV